MAMNKASRKRQLAVSNWQSAGENRHTRTNSSHAPDTPMPIKTHVYRTIAELNGGFEKVLNDLKTLGQVSFFRSLSANSLHCQLSRIRAQVNREFALTLYDREMANAGYFERLCHQLESAGDDSEAAKA